MRGNVRSIALFVAVNVISLVCLVWALHGVELAKLRHDIAHLNWWWASIAAISNVLVYILQGWRWSLILAPVTRVPVMQSAKAIYVGLYANEVLPLRSGEIIRCYLQARWSDLPISVALASALIERIFDGVLLIAALFFTIRQVSLPAFIRNSGYFLTILIMVCAVLLAIAMYWREQTLDRLANAPKLGWAHVLIKDLHLIGHSRYLYYAFLVSVAFLLLQVLPMYAAVQSLQGVRKLSIMGPFAIMVVLRLNAALPQAPGNIGTFQWATIRVLVLFDIHRNVAQSFALILWGIVTLPMFAVGFVAVALTGLNMRQLHRDAHTSVKDRDPVSERDAALKP